MDRSRKGNPPRSNVIPFRIPTPPPAADALSWLGECANCHLMESCEVRYGDECPPGTPGALVQIRPPANAGAVVKFPVPPDDFSDVDPFEFARRFQAARLAGVAEVSITQREADAVRYWREERLAVTHPKAVIVGRS